MALRIFSCALVVALVGAGSALADSDDPQRRISPADQARAKAMLLRAADVPGYTAVHSTPPAPDFDCPALDESDLTLTGQAASASFQQGDTSAGSAAQVFESVADANASWRRRTSPAVERCARALVKRGLRDSGGKLVSHGQVAFPRLAERTVAARLVVVVAGRRIETVTVVFTHRRAQAFILLTAIGRPAPRAEVERLARAVAARMQTAMRGA